jgi:hypothetical protein
MSPQTLEAGYWRAYREFYEWGSIARSAWTKSEWSARLRHLAYSGGWKKFEPAWDLVIRMKKMASFLPVLEGVLNAASGRDRKANLLLRRPNPEQSRP